MNTKYPLRLFFALSIDSVLQQKLKDLVQQWHNQFSKEKINWTPPENYHVTICFLGAAQWQQISTLVDYTDKALQIIKRFDLHFDKVIFFPRLKPSMLVIKLMKSKELSALHRAVKKAATAAGFKVEKRLFLPHITLGKFAETPANANYFLEKIILPTCRGQKVQELILYNSDTNSTGSIYTPVHQFRF